MLPDIFFIEDLYPKIKVVFYLPNTAFHIQPTDQGVIPIFKGYRQRTTFAQAPATTEENT